MKHKNLDIDDFKEKCLNLSDMRVFYFNFNKGDRKFAVMSLKTYQKLTGDIRGKE